MTWGGHKVRQLLWQAAATWGTRCAICGQPVDMSLRYPDPLSPTVEHVTPRSRGGTDSLANLRVAHHTCNVRKGNRPKTGKIRPLKISGLF
nr:MAG TPA: HNH endonuclease [Caudoviricetes sp.]